MTARLTLACALLAISLAGLLAEEAPARQGDIDRSFGKRGFVTIPLAKSKRTVQLIDTAVQSDGKFLALALLLKSNNDGYGWLGGRSALFRFTPSGRLDRSFGHGGVVRDVLQRPDRETPAALTLAADDSIAVAGTIQNMAQTQARPAVARFDSSGDRTVSFGTAGVAHFSFASPIDSSQTERVSSIVQTGAGTLLIAGTNTSANSDLGVNAAVAQLKADGQLETAFGDAGVLRVPSEVIGRYTGSSANEVISRSDGTFMVVGSSTINVKPENKEDRGVRTSCMLAKFDSTGKAVSPFGTAGQLHIFFGISYSSVAAPASCGELLTRDDGSYLAHVVSPGTGSKSYGFEEVFAVPATGATSTAIGRGSGREFPDVPWQTGFYEGHATSSGLLLGPSESIYAGFNYASLEYDKYRSGLIRVDGDGKRDRSFGTDGVAIAGKSRLGFRVTGIDRARAGRLLVSGWSNSFHLDRPALRFARVIAR